MYFRYFIWLYFYTSRSCHYMGHIFHPPDAVIWQKNFSMAQCKHYLSANKVRMSVTKVRHGRYKIVAIRYLSSEPRLDKFDGTWTPHLRLKYKEANWFVYWPATAWLNSRTDKMINRKIDRKATDRLNKCLIHSELKAIAMSENETDLSYWQKVCIITFLFSLREIYSVVWKWPCRTLINSQRSCYVICVCNDMV